MNFTSKNLSISDLDEVFAKIKPFELGFLSESQVSSEFISDILQILSNKSIENRDILYEILSKIDLKLQIEPNQDAIDKILENDEKIDEESIAKLMSEIAINKDTIDSVCDKYDISPNEIDEILKDKIQNCIFSNFYKIDEENDEFDDKIIKVSIKISEKIDQTQGNHNNIGNIDNLSFSKLCDLKISIPSFSKSVRICDEFRKKLIKGQLISKDFLTSCLEFIKKDDINLTFDEFCKIFDQNLVLAYDFLSYFVDLIYFRDIKKKR